MILPSDLIGRFHTKVAHCTWHVEGGEKHITCGTVISDQGYKWHMSLSSQEVDDVIVLRPK